MSSTYRLTLSLLFLKQLLEGNIIFKNYKTKYFILVIFPLETKIGEISGSYTHICSAF